MHQLDAQGMSINFASVVTAATVSRSWLYRDADIRASVERRRTERRRQPTPVAQRASDDSIQRQREARIDESVHLKYENKQLRAEVATVGDRRSAPVIPSTTCSLPVAAGRWVIPANHSR